MQNKIPASVLRDLLSSIGLLLKKQPFDDLFNDFGHRAAEPPTTPLS
jgi:hypothetical protein